MDLLTILTILIIISAVFSYLNERFVKLPGTIGVVAISVVISIVILITGRTQNALTNVVKELAQSIDFSRVLLDIMLGLLLFASALHFDYQKLKEQRLPVLLLSTLGVMVSAGVFGLLLFVGAKLTPLDIPLVYCFLFGALISPTDPIAVAAILKKSNIPPRLSTIIAGESLFNDGVGLVLFVVLLEVADPLTATPSFEWVLQVFVQEVLGGIAIGLAIGYLGFRLIKSIDSFQTILLLSLAMVLGISIAASKLHASIPLGTVTAGLVMGNKALDKRSEANQFLARIWQLLDEVLNTVLFVMIGLQLVVMPFLNNYWLIGFLSIVILLVARATSISLPAGVLLHRVSAGNLSILTWAGLRGGISVAMALSLPPSPYREVILSSCYFIVIFSIIIQGLTLNRLVERVAGKNASANAH